MPSVRFYPLNRNPRNLIERDLDQIEVMANLDKVPEVEPLAFLVSPAQEFFPCH